MGMTVGQAIIESIQAEKVAEEIYRGLERKFSADPEISAFWNLFATEEARHVEWLMNLPARMGESDLEKSIDTQTQELFFQVRLFTPEQVLDNIHNLADAFETVNDFENGETNAVFRFLIDNFEVDKQIRDFLMAQLAVHIARLSTNLPARFRNVLARRAVEAS
jgi:rubrerythrin